MPTYIDIHDIRGVTAEDVAKAHAADLEKQDKYGVNYLKYWVNESCGKVFCLVNAPNAEAARQVHREAHGMVAEKIIEVQPEIAEGFLGGGEEFGWRGVNPRRPARGARSGHSDSGICRHRWLDHADATLWRRCGHGVSPRARSDRTRCAGLQ